MSGFITSLASALTQGSVFALIALGFLLIYRATGVVNFAQGDLVTLGAYLSYWAYHDLELTLLSSWLLAVAIMFVVGVALERFAYAPIRTRSEHTVVIATLGAAMVIRASIAIWQDTSPKFSPDPFNGEIMELAGARIPYQNLLVIGATVVIVAGTLLLVGRTGFGRSIRALAADRGAASLVGIPVSRVSMLAFGLSSALAGVAGVLIAPTQALTVDLGFGPMLFAFAAAVLVGLGRIGAVLLGAVAIGIAQYVVGRYVFPDFRDLYPFILMLAVLAIRPRGLLGEQVGRRV
ncbi:MAG: branched-chain amino acid ABC transporter permease [Frankia sp.]|nr:branched-chain amino acid ABC transporter permease [Frankia sp.]